MLQPDYLLMLFLALFPYGFPRNLTLQSGSGGWSLCLGLEEYIIMDRIPETLSRVLVFARRAISVLMSPWMLTHALPTLTVSGLVLSSGSPCSCLYSVPVLARVLTFGFS
jgi:hypothetical protein